MRGQILSFDDASGTGSISGDDGIRYAFQREAVTHPETIATGLRVDFVPIAGEATSVLLLAAAAPGTPSATPGVPTDNYDFARAMFAFDGRLRRSHFWISWAILFVAGFILNLIPFLNLIGILFLWPHLAIGVKRLHDMGKTGWLIAIPYAVMILGFIAAMTQIIATAIANEAAINANDTAAILAMIVPAMGILGLTWIVGIAFLLWIGIADSQRGENRFGPNPKSQ